MTFSIRRYDPDKDLANFMKLSFETLISVKGTPPGVSRNEFYEWAKEWVIDYMNELDLNTIFIAEDADRNYCGHIWISLQEELKPWESERYIWIQNITVKKNFRKLGIGTMLMRYVENWMINQKRYKVGLHVNIESKDAIKLYKDLGYVEYQTQLIKNVDSNSNSKDLGINFQQDSIEEDFNALKKLLFRNFEFKLRTQAPKSTIVAKFDDYIKKFLENKEDRYVFKLVDKHRSLKGVSIISITEWRYQKCMWIEEIGFINEGIESNLFSELIAYLEDWGAKEKIQVIQVNPSRKQTNLTELCIGADFVIVGYFLQKKLN